MIVANSRRFIFVHIHKTGGSSMELAIAPHLRWNDVILGSTPLGRAANQAFRDAHGLFDHASAEEIAFVCGSDLFESYYSFALVRHPLDRAVSMYNFLASLCRFAARRRDFSRAKLAKFVLDRRDHSEEFAVAVERDPFLGWPITAAFLEHERFGDFIRAPETRSDRSFLPQVDMVRSLDGRVRVRDCVRLEDLPLRVSDLSRKLGIPLEIGHHNAAPFLALERRDLRNDDMDYLLHEFGEDILAFDYGV
ncbi:sulfotransferase family 2 domain-containing protein [Defluviimonas sp. WL0002]|uniref:Sulfotransferase family 2 domain-containing protein n=1 Tax=Albidovulum marisflavi TaxID=2984159 RepID=A0ABT2ZC35_9RHOB|nr:sulfotransferase family 2 domain-containing protein [Defluviimonas sp. WL0002]MCV2868708.1 sulfotransferase family 2 domain-containing protein [Defluviimonas sp. WL0002]